MDAFRCHAEVTGQVKHRRKLHKQLFFVDLQPEEDNQPKIQILFRTNDGTTDVDTFREAYKACRLGNIIHLSIGWPTDPAENEGKSFKVYQSIQIPTVINEYPIGRPFVSDHPMGTDKPKTIIRATDGSTHLKSNLYCKFWINQRECARLPDCPFLHPSEEEYKAARESWINERLTSRRLVTHDPHDPHESKKSHTMRAMVFAKWIYDTLKPSMVLDVAGGKGDVSMFLTHAFDIPAACVEPNPRKRSKQWRGRLRRLAANLQHPDTERPIEQWPFEREPEFLTCMMDDAFLAEQTRLLDQVTALVGLHADQATEPIVDTALRLGKAFAVIPCCVFAHENRHRRLQSGASVTTTEDFVQYLCEKDTQGRGSVQKAYLDFVGKNVVVYWIPTTS
ncbi:hypothetical protein BCR43DRAFT_529503 [Syncephalastrum racemosum]|uniref:C3H1-type domain-containing protein n=1 Tax=Syncephalastrum racemosum TaxID=13706 RepID=A0A1X2HNT1_SYNRA|nr:hypothetical protein BCR43DRAFT_529503 [Syncephalastrum racemosum]